MLAKGPAWRFNWLMKKILLRVAIVVVVLLVLCVLALGIFLDGAVKRGVEAIGPKLTKVDIKLNAVRLSLFSGSGTIKGLVVGNPEGYKTPQAMNIGSASLALKPASLLSDKIVIKSIRLEAPVITFEGGFGGNNLSQILKNVEAATGGGSESKTNTAAKEKTPGKKLEVDDFMITGARLNVSVKGMEGKSIPVVLPDIHLTDLGTGPEGITAGELTRRVLSAIDKDAVKAANQAVADLGKSATGLTKDVGKSAGEDVNKVTKGIGDLFKKK